MEANVQRLIGLADGCELLSVAFSFPTKDLARALLDGSFESDAQSCLTDIGAPEKAEQIGRRISGLGARKDVSQMLEALRHGHSALYLLPTGAVRVWPYEAPFFYRLEGNAEAPVLFRSRRQLDVEKAMRGAGVIPKDARQEPADSVWNELSFLSYLYGSLAGAVYEGHDESAAVFGKRIASFWREHGSGWLPFFMEQTRNMSTELSFGEEYAVFSELADVFLATIDDDVRTGNASMAFETLG